MRLGIIDDHALFSDGIRAWLRDEAPDVDLVVSTASIETVLDAAAELDVVLLDIDLGPGSVPLNEAVRRLVEADLKVIIVSAHSAPRLVRRGLGAGALGYLSKRESGPMLLEALRTVGRGEPFLTPDLAAILAEDADDIPALSAQEIKALRLYASGIKVDTVARRMGVSPATVREYLERVKRKYHEVGRPARSKTELGQVAAEDGLLPLVAYRSPPEAEPPVG
jgi:DNA-binding NarL/FixJ family response regulator